MLTRKSINGIGRMIRLGSKTKVLPFIWNDKSRRIEVGSRKQRTIMAVIIMYMYFEAAYQIYRLVTGHLDKSVQLTKYMKLVALFATRLTALIIQTIAFVYTEDVKYFANQLLNMNAGFIEIYGHKEEVRDPCKKFLAFLYWFASLHPIATAADYAMENKDSRYWHGALLPTRVQPFFVPVFVLVEYWIGLFSELGCVFLGCLMLAFCRATPVWMNELTAMLRNRKTELEKVITLYRAMLILCRAYNNALSLILAYGSFALLVDLTITLTCSLRVTPMIGLSGLLFSIVSLALVLAVELTIRPAANLTTPSTEFLTAFSQAVSAKRCGNKRRGYVANMEKPDDFICVETVSSFGMGSSLCRIVVDYYRDGSPKILCRSEVTN